MIVAIIPIFNPDNNFYDFILEVKKYIQYIIIIDDGSLIPILINIKDVKVLRNKVNRGKGYSLRKAFKYAIKNNNNLVITIDGDCQHDPKKIKDFIKVDNKFDIVITEVGGTVGDIEGQPFYEAIRQMILELGKENCLVIHTTLLPFIDAAGEIKTKPTQHSVMTLREIGLAPDVLVCRTEHNHHLTEKLKKKLEF